MNWHQDPEGAWHCPHAMITHHPGDVFIPPRSDQWIVWIDEDEPAMHDGSRHASFDTLDEAKAFVRHWSKP